MSKQSQQLSRSQQLKNLLRSKTARRVYRIAAFAVGAGIAFMGAGNIYQMSALESAMFGATGSLLGLAMALAFTYAGKAEVSDDDFNKSINSAIEGVNSKSADKDTEKS